MARSPLSATIVVSAMIIAALAAPGYAAEPIVAGITNIAAAANGGHIVAFSSQALDENGKVMPEWQVTNIIDGKQVVGNYTPADSYGWNTQYVPSNTDPQWVVIAFEGDRTHLLRRIVIDPATDDPDFIGRWVRDIEVQVSTTTPEGPYRPVTRPLVMNKPIEQSFDFLPVEARYVRLIITGNHGSDKCVGIGEVEIYEAIVAESIIDDLIVRLEGLLNDLKRYRDFQLYRQEQETLEAVTTKPTPPASSESSGEAEGG